MDYQSITIVGNVRREPKIYNLPDRSKVAKFSVAINRYLRSGEHETLWFQVDGWNWLADVVEKHLYSGCRVLVEEELIRDPQTHRPKTHVRSDGTVGTSFVIWAEKTRLLDSRKGGEQTSRSETGVSKVEEYEIDPDAIPF